MKKTKNVFVLTAIGFDAAGISLELTMPISEVYWRLQFGRKRLREKCGETANRKDTNKLGVRRDGRRWSASITIGGARKHLGMFATSSDAEAAYLAAKATL